MTRARVVVRLGVVVRALVLVLDEEADGSAERDASLDTRLDLDGIRLVALRGSGQDVRSRPSASHEERTVQEW